MIFIRLNRLVASIINKLGLTQRIDKLIPLKGNIKTTVGQRVFAFILNGLGFIDTRMYLFPEFLKNKPVDLLLGTDGLKQIYSMMTHWVDV